MTLFLVALAAYCVKAATGFGPAIVVVGVGGLIIGHQEAIVLAALLDTTSGAAVTTRTDRPGYPYLALGLSMVVGAVLGGAMLSRVSSDVVAAVVAATVLVLGFVMLVRGRLRWRPPLEDAVLQVRRRRWRDAAAGSVSGFCGGFTGIGGPPLVAYLHVAVRHSDFRPVLVRTLLFAAVARVATYTAEGLVTAEILTTLLVTLPAMPLGLLVGERLFAAVDESQFNRIVGFVMVASGVKGFL